MTNWKEIESEKEIIWICGGIDCHGVVHGHASCRRGGTLAHTAEEKNGGVTWRWDVGNQQFMDHIIPPRRYMTEEDWCKIQDWLIKNGYAEPASFIWGFKGRVK